MILGIFSSGLETWQAISLFVTLIAALVISLTLHEFAHAYVALLNGDRTAKLNGRVSLNPMRHIDPIGFLLVLFAGFGYAKPVPVNPNNFKNHKVGIFTVSIAGVAVNLFLAIISSGIYVALIKFSSLNTNSFLLLFLGYFQIINLILFFFNLLPFFPLDGFNLLSSFLKPNNKFLVFMRRNGYYILLALVGLSIIVDRFDPGNVSWWRYFDILGTYFEYTAWKVFDGLLWVWSKIFGL